MSTIFKPLTKADIPEAVTLMRDFYAIDNYHIDPATSEALFTEFISNDNLGRAWLIYSDNELIGYTIITFIFSFEYKGRYAFLDELYLSEKARGKGIGKQAIEFIKAEALKLKLKVIYLEVENHNENAQKLYLAQNFTVHHRKMMKYIVA
ncbi:MULTISPECIES: GNAT family N-acetyltransferase [unclassified Flavobacterium]|uniref:GNAT family N-acetyltransferase n=1 Tax=unclassified Flavobacterium TaxID=196869 RepID=UPI00086C120B|nr:MULTISPECIES: GNAT family N-acetyltransferase [unclassified Flavobacterium]ODS82291.1 MAG: GNAT family N-acetyltransferase [Chryseobacterium sp. SCN 40-13]OJV72988.1 MAG: GNAT family N-acetyltransferase [Flavobacterium sp. 40-81]HRB72759.1 GNAT family N-acetyltransferase [Flavobacterium sp.]